MRINIFFTLSLYIAYNYTTMKPTFHAHPVNGPFEDPCVYIDIFREGRAFLFDLGDLRRMPAGKLLRVTDIFVTHMHIDHFIGFDTILRTALRSETPLRLYGPRGLLGCVRGKLSGYSWNLIRDYPLRIEAYEIGAEGIAGAHFTARDSFAETGGLNSSFSGEIRTEGLFTVRATLLSHDIPVLAYSLQEDYHLNVNKDLLGRKGLPVGPWLAELKDAIRAGSPGSLVIAVEGRRFPLSEMRDLVTVTRGQKISYAMDVSPTQENCERLVDFVRGSDTFFCEAFFLERDREKALARHHLTAASAGRIAREAGVGTLVLLHFSPRYRDCEADICREAADVFGGTVTVCRAVRPES